MIIRTRGRRRASRLAVTWLFSVASFGVAGAAKSPPDSLAVLRAALPDSVALDSQVVYLDFWASWCVPCRQSFPWMQALYDSYRTRGLQIVAVSVDKDHRAALKFLSEHRVAFPIVFDSTGALAKKYGLGVMPTSFLYGRDGRLAMRHEGFQSDRVGDVDSALVALIKRADAP
jgi:cytochrome c biogenesis protein CcmG/thiol:disulfide interchange protein DsbE